jgi:hypothetical protein
MVPQRSVDIAHLRRDIEATRASISRTAGELRRKASEAMQWQTYVERYPATILGAAVFVGVALGRRIARGLDRSSGHHSNRREWPSAAAGIDTVTRIPARLESQVDRPAAITASWQRLGSRVEGLVNRMIDDVADAAERAIVPALVAGVEALLEGRVTRPVYRPAPPNRTSAPEMGERRWT